MLCKASILFQLSLYSAVSDYIHFYLFYPVYMCYLSLKSEMEAVNDGSPAKNIPPDVQFSSHRTAFALYRVNTPATWHRQMSFCLNEFSKNIARAQNASVCRVTVLM